MADIQVTFRDGRQPMIVPEENLHNVRRLLQHEIKDIKFLDSDPDNEEPVFIDNEEVFDIEENNSNKSGKETPSKKAKSTRKTQKA